MKRNVKSNFTKAIAIIGIAGFAGGAYVAGSDLLVHEVVASTAEITNADATLTFKGSEVTGKGDGYEINDGVVTITEAGTYVLQGNGENVQILVDAKDQNVILILNGVTLSNETDAPIYFKNANLATVVVQENTVNTLSDSEATEEITDENERAANAVIYSKGDLTVEGTGKLVVNANYKNGISSKDNLVINSGEFEINAANHGIVGKDSITIVNGTFNITAGADGFQSDNTDLDKGFVTIEDGTFNITSANDAIQAESTLTINNGDFNITTNGGAEANTTSHQETMGGGMGGQFTEGQMPTGDFAQGQMPTGDFVQGQPPELPGEMQFGADGRPTGKMAGATDGTTSASTETTTNQPPALPGEMQFDESGRPTGTTADSTVESTTETTTSEEETVSDSYKGLKATNIIISNGTFVINSNDDAIHGNNDITINDGTFTLSTGDDAIHAENYLTINGGDIEVVTSYEGFEGFKIEINGGNIDITASDDAINASSSTGTFGGEMMGGSTTYNEETDPAIIINGGTINTDSQSDGLDTNGVLLINGGDVTVNGPNSNVEVLMDFVNYGEIDGGSFIAVGGTSNMFANFATSSEQVAFAYFWTSQQSAGSTLEVLDSTGKVVATIEPTKAYTSVVVSSPDLVKGATYTIKNGTSTETITLSSTDTITTYGYSGGGMGGGNRGTMGGRGTATMPGATTDSTTQASATTK